MILNGAVDDTGPTTKGVIEAVTTDSVASGVGALEKTETDSYTITAPTKRFVLRHGTEGTGWGAGKV